MEKQTTDKPKGPSKGPRDQKNFKRPRRDRSGGGDFGEKEFDQTIIDLARVTRVMAGGKRMRFRACVAIGDKKGRVGVAVAKGADVTIAINKAVTKAKKHLLTLPIVNETIPYEVHVKFGSARILLKPAPRGTGVKAGGSVRSILILVGVPNVVGKILGSKNKINNVFATLDAIRRLQYIKVTEKKPAAKAQSQDAAAPAPVIK